MGRQGTVLFVLAVWLGTACASQAPGAFPWKEGDVEALMESHDVPGLSVAVMDDFELVWSGAFGVAETGTDMPVTEETLFQTASIGKSVTAATALHQVGLGVIDLDTDVHAYLTSWTLPDNVYTAQNAISIRSLLSHTAGVNVHGFFGYPPTSPIPDLRQILDGTPPANNEPIRVDSEPGVYRYSGGGYQILEQVLEDISGQNFPSLVTETIFEPLGMSTSIYDPLPESEWSRAAIGHRAEGSPLVGGWHQYPEHAAGPFWTTPSDFALFGIEVMAAYTGRSETVMTQELATEMLTPVDAGYGLGLGITDDGGGRLHATHDGANEGFQTMLVLYPDRGQGAVIMTNSDNGLALADDLVDSLSLHFRWVGGIILTPAQTLLLVMATMTVATIILTARRRRHRRQAADNE
jgi:CubicO group peptidase (beta-lactamase class C family)